MKRSTLLRFAVRLAAATLAAATGVAACSSSTLPPAALDSDEETDAGSYTTPDGHAADARPEADGSTGGTGNGNDGGGTTPTSDASPNDARTTPSDAFHGFDVEALPDAASLDAYAPCGFLTCSPGCCASDGACVSGNDVNACGGSGNACVDCTATGQACSGSQCM